MHSSPFEFSSDNKRYHTLSYHFRSIFGHKLYKAAIDCGFTCPNADGTKGTGGCIFCDGGSGYFTRHGLSVTTQLDSERKRLNKKYGSVPIIAYFQANTNTYAPITELREKYLEAASCPDVAAISIGTRSDCLPDEVLELISDLNSRIPVTVELGMQTVHNETLRRINRCCDHEEFLEGYHRLKEKNIRVCLHIINGLPGETADMMLETAKEIATLHPDGVKLQMLHVIQGTRLADEYSSGSITLLSQEEYTDIIVRQLEILPPDTVIERITGDGDRRKLISPMWSADKKSVIAGIDKRLSELDTWQGRLYDNRRNSI
ncbi:MAG: TIGR01212 family radical SAM protein [Ruminococcus sp.]|nr:TIGR01212 family radical SAM protein [Ruminococcus sp.]